MDLKCLIKLLLEKEIILENETFKDNQNRVIVKTFKFDYYEVLTKLQDSIYDEENIVIEEGNRRQLFVANKTYLKEFLIDKLNGELEGSIKTDKIGIADYKLKNIFKNDKDIKIENVLSGIIKVYDLKERRRLKEIEQKKKDEVIAFLNELP